ncbi:transposase [Umezawaea tangerina]|uniref:Transposase n=1 Tax=Umezawaea tangerina TaxID=84725 RepID=A0A2T0S6Y9_9PSEU|nr:transposase [Umezawaea tangerina]PRY29191.1 transposase [Umezawaea tangerina]
MAMKHYPPESKTEAVTLYRSRADATIRAVAEDLGINHETLRNWIRTDDALAHLPRPEQLGLPLSMPASPESKNTALHKRIRKLE